MRREGAPEHVDPCDVDDALERKPTGAWWVCCGDAALFLGPVGKTELQGHGDEAIAAIRVECGRQSDDWQQYFDALDREHGPTAYIFRCRHCGKLGGYSDCH